MADDQNLLDEFAVTFELDGEQAQQGAAAIISALDKLTAVMTSVAEHFDISGDKIQSALSQVNAAAMDSADEVEDGSRRTQDALNKTGKKAGETAKKMEADGKKAKGFFSGMRKEILALAGVTLTLGGVMNMVEKLGKSTSAMATKATAYDVSPQRLDGLEKTARQKGASSEDADELLSKISNSRTLYKSGRGVDDFARAATELGLGLGDLADNKPEDTVKRISELLHRRPEEQRRYWGSQRLGMSDAMWEAMSGKDFNASFDRNTAGSQTTPEFLAQGQKLNEAIERVKDSFSNLKTAIGAVSMPFLDKFAKWLSEIADWANKHPEEIKAAIQGFLDKAVEIAGKVDSAVESMGGWKTVIEGLIALKVVSWVTGITGAFSKLLGLGGGKLGLMTPWVMAAVAYADYASEDKDNIKDSAESSWRYTKRNIGDLLRDIGIDTDWGRDGSTVQGTPGVVSDIPGVSPSQPTPLEPEQHAQSARRAKPTPTQGNFPRGIRNNNPGNLNFAGQRGAVLESGKDPRFAAFATLDDGLSALNRQIGLYFDRGLNTVQKIISTYAPKSENRTSDYITNIASRLGVDPSQRLDRNDPEMMQKLLRGIVTQEGTGAYISDEQIARAAGNRYSPRSPARTGGSGEADRLIAELASLMRQPNTDSLKGVGASVQVGAAASQPVQAVASTVNSTTTNQEYNINGPVTVQTNPATAQNLMRDITQTALSNSTIIDYSSGVKT